MYLQSELLAEGFCALVQRKKKEFGLHKRLWSEVAHARAQPLTLFPLLL